MVKVSHKWIYYALTVCVSTFAAFESPRLLLFIGILLVFMWVKKEHTVHVLMQISVALFFFIFVRYEYNQLQKTIEMPSTLTWTDHYKINGNMLKGFMKSADGQKIYVSYEIKSEKEKFDLLNRPLVGERYFVEGVMEEPREKAHSYAFDMKQYLKSEGAIGIVEIKKWQLVSSEPSLLERISRLRFYLKQHIDETFPSSLASEAKALLIGEKSNVDQDVNRAYQKLGITHLFAISGLHVGIIVLIIYEGLLFCKVRKELALIILLIALPIYGILAGGAPSVWRSVSVVEFLLIGRIKNLSVDDALNISFIVFILLDPFAIYQIGFQLSYLATYSLIYSSSIISRFKKWWTKTFIITFLCQLIVYPLLLFHFFELSLSSFAMNIIFVPLFSFIVLPINILLLALTFIPIPIADLIFFIYEPCRTLISDFINFCQSIPNQMWIAGKPTKQSMTIAYISVLATFYLIDVKDKLWKVVLVLMIPILIIHFQTKWFSEMKISFINVGQGDSILMELPYQKEVYLIDTGGVLRFQEEVWKKRDSIYEVGRQVVVPYLKGKGINKIDKLILTHGDSDHVEGAEEIAKEIAIGEIHISPNSMKKRVFKDLLKEVDKKNIPIIEPVAGLGWHSSNIQFQYLWPMDTKYEGNNDSLVLYVKMGAFEGLFTGDLEQSGELEVMKNFPTLQKIDLLKAGHHGSKTSSHEEFLQQLMPTVTIFSAGENNRYNHPHKEVVEKYHDLGLRTMSTIDYGTIEFIIRDGEIRVNTSKKLKENSKLF